MCNQKIHTSLLKVCNFFNLKKRLPDKMQEGDHSQPWKAGGSENPKKTWIPLGSVNRLPPKKQFPSLGRHGLGDPSAIATASFQLPQMATRSPPLIPLPDIYTTCPELRNFKPLHLPTIGTLDPPVLATTSTPGSVLRSSPTEKKFDPNEQILRPYFS